MKNVKKIKENSQTLGPSNALVSVWRKDVLFNLYFFLIRCYGKWIRQICNFGLGDLPRLESSSCLTANKFNLDVDPLAAVCQAQKISIMGN